MLRQIRKITCLILTAVLAVSFAGCGRFISDASSIFNKTYEKRYADKASQMERSEEMMNNIISCLNKDDKTGLKGLFSQVAVKRSGTLDEDLDQLLNDFNDVKSAGTVTCSAYGQSGDEGWYYLTCNCAIETSKGKMTLSWLDVPRKVKERSCEGLYSLAILENGDFYKTAGVYKADLGTFMAKGIAFARAAKVRFNGDTEYLSNNLTDECLAAHSEEELLALEWFLSRHPVANYLKWTSVSGDTVYVFIEMYFSGHPVVLCAGYDKDDPDKITHISLADCGKDDYASPADTPSGDEVINAGLGDVLKIYNEKNG